MVTFHEPVADCVAVPLATDDVQAIEALVSRMSTTPSPSPTKLAPGNSCTRRVAPVLAPDVTVWVVDAAADVALTHAEPLTMTLFAGSLAMRTSGASPARRRSES